jgi:integrase
MSENRLLFERILGLDDSWNTSTYESVNKWIKAVRRRGDRYSTKLAYLKWMSYFLRFMNLTEDETAELGKRLTPPERKEELIAKIRQGLTPDGLLLLSNESVSEKVQAFCDRYNETGKARTAHLSLNYLRSFFKHNGVEKLNVEDYNWRKSRRMEYVPTKEEVYRIAEHCDARGKAILLCAFQSGLRNSAIRALCHGDIKEQLETGKMPIRIHVNSELRQRVPQACKEDAEYYTFFGKEATQALRDYMEWRVNKYGKIGEDEPLFTPYEAFSQPKSRSSALSEDSPQRLIKRAARRARIKDWRHVRFHSLRKSFRAVLDAGYVDGGQMAEDDKEYLMGHTLSSSKEPYHNANAEVLEQRYMKLNWSPTFQVTRETKVEMIKTFAQSLGIAELEVKIQKLREEQPELEEMEAIGKVMREELGINPLKTKMVKYRKNDEEDDCSDGNCRKYERRIVTEKELLPHLDEGWSLVKELRSGRIVVKRLLQQRARAPA